MSRAPQQRRRFLRWLVISLAVVIALVLVLALVAFAPYRIPSAAMEPTLNCAKPGFGCLGDSRDRVLACRVCLHFESPSRDDIVVFHTPTEATLKCGEGGTFVKRVIGLPGETVHEDGKGFIWIREPDAKKFVKLNEPFISAKDRLSDSQDFGLTRHVPKGEYFVMGDNRSESCDSRAWGSVPRNELIGPVVFRYWPLSRIGFP